LLADLTEDPFETGVAQLVAQAEVVFHLAARSGVRADERSIDELRFRDNVVATRNLLSVTPLDTMVVATSSSSVYGGAAMLCGQAVPSKETDDLVPRGGYALSKVGMEKACERHRDRGGTIAVLRPFTVVGERQRPDMAFSIWMRALEASEPIEFLGSPERSRDLTDVRDVVEAIIRAAERRVVTTINVGTGVGHRLSDMARTLMEVTGMDAELIVSEARPEEAPVTLADPTRCAQALGFVPSTDLYGIVSRVVAAEQVPVLAAS
jgi:nucleoside-diphosphate-sugar epimerase